MSDVGKASMGEDLPGSDDSNLEISPVFVGSRTWKVGLRGVCLILREVFEKFQSLVDRRN